jgi:hypothetical protein
MDRDSLVVLVLPVEIDERHALESADGRQVAAGELVLLGKALQIFLYGAEFTYVYAQRSGKPLVPKEHAKPVTEEARARRG